MQLPLQDFTGLVCDTGEMSRRHLPVIIKRKGGTLDHSRWVSSTNGFFTKHLAAMKLNVKAKNPFS